MDFKLFDNHKSKITNVLTKVLRDDPNFYCYTMSMTGISIQGSYKAIYVKRLILRGFELSNSDKGYLYCIKHIAGIRVQFVLTD